MMEDGTEGEAAMCQQGQGPENYQHELHPSSSNIL